MNKSSSRDAAPPSGRKRFFHFWRCFWLLFLVVSLAYAWYSYYVPSNEIAWAHGVPSAQEQAAAADKPMILYFTGTWCVPCRVMKRQVWADREVKVLVNARYVPVMLDVDDPENADLVAQYKIRGVPVTILTDPEGEVLDWRAGGLSKAEFLEIVEASRGVSVKGG